ncbi:MAG: hypothetical protein M3071_17835 [Actinomycetota bacterium]|nr:hypothetical protein [Actinomycetota bacterium]
MTGERELSQRQTAWVRGATSTKLGTAILTSQRLLFFDTKFMGGVAGGALGVALAERLQKRHEDGGPLLELPLSTLTRIERQKKLLNKDRIVLVAADDENVFTDGWKDWSQLLLDVLRSDHGRDVVEDGSERGRIEPR